MERVQQQQHLESLGCLVVYNCIGEKKTRRQLHGEGERKKNNLHCLNYLVVSSQLSHGGNSYTWKFRRIGGFWGE